MKISHSLDWTINEKSGGIWRIAHLINQGQPTQNLVKLRHLRKKEFKDPYGDAEKDFLNLVPDNALFGAAISELSVDSSELRQRTLIKPHYGVTNAKWRAHFPLAVDNSLRQNLFLTVNGEDRDWSKPFVMDDSFLHQVSFRPREMNKSDTRLNRTVLLLDLWNENITLEDRDCANFIIKLLL